MCVVRVMLVTYWSSTTSAYLFVATYGVTELGRDHAEKRRGMGSTWFRGTNCGPFEGEEDNC